MIRQRLKEGFPGQRLVVVPPMIVEHALKLPVCRWLMPTHIGSFDHARNHFVARAKGVQEQVLIVCLEGEGFVRIGPRSWSMRQGGAVLLPPGQKHQYGADEGRPWSILWVHFEGEGSEDYRRMLLMDETDPVFQMRDLVTVIDAFEETFRHVLGGYRDVDLIGLATACGRFFGCCRLQRGAREGPRREAEDRVLRTIHFMKENLDRPLSLDELAKASNWAPSYFSEVFRRQTNSPPALFLTRLRMQRACELLKTTDAAIAQIADAVGYPDAFYFSRVFSKQIGMPPAVYRKTYGF